MIELTVEEQIPVELTVNEQFVSGASMLIATDDGQGNVTLSNIAAIGDGNVTLSSV